MSKSLAPRRFPRYKHINIICHRYLLNDDAEVIDSKQSIGSSYMYDEALQFIRGPYIHNGPSRSTCLPSVKELFTNMATPSPLVLQSYAGLMVQRSYL